MIITFGFWVRCMCLESKGISFSSHKKRSMVWRIVPFFPWFRVKHAGYTSDHASSDPSNSMKAWKRFLRIYFLCCRKTTVHCHSFPILSINKQTTVKGSETVLKYKKVAKKKVGRFQNI